MEESTKKSIKIVSIIVLSVTAFALFSKYVPDNSGIKTVLSIIMIIIMILGVLWLTPIGNPFKDLYKKWRGIK